MEIIAKHIPNENLKAKIYTAIDTVCAFSGKNITEGVLLEDCISDVFTDFEYIKYTSKYVSIDYAKVILDTIKNDGKRNNALRSYSYFASQNELRFLKREDCLDLLLNIPKVPFHICISFNYKKHTSFKSVANYDADNYTVTTDLFNVKFSKPHILAFLPIIQEWYSVIPEKANTAAQPTWFTKEEILNGNAQFHKTKIFGLDKFEEQNEFLKQFRNTQIFNLIVHLLNKSFYEKN